MAVPNTPNADLEQALFKANLKEKRLRRRAMMAVIFPLLAGLAWLGYSYRELSTWQWQADEIIAQKAAAQQREQEASQRVEDAEAKLATTEASVQTFQQQEKAATERAVDIRQRLVKVREEIGGLGALLTDLSSAKAKASKLMNSEAVESQITDVRAALSKSLARVEQEIDKALPAEEQKARIYLFISDDSQNAMAKELAPVLESAGFDVAGISKNSTRRVDESEIRYFREPEDKADATRIQNLVIKQTGLSDCKIFRTSDADNASGSRKFQIWLGKPAAAVR
ncbi:MAG: hypothetical protein ABIZ56_07105 [Chthoniobacteraceae bacterium]